MRIDSLLAATGVAPANKADAKTSLDEREAKRLKTACKDFEAMFLTNLLKAMRKTIDKSDLFGTDQAEDTFQEMLDTEIGKSATKTSSMGIADALYRQLTTQMANEAQNKVKTNAN